MTHILVGVLRRRAEGAVFFLWIAAFVPFWLLAWGVGGWRRKEHVRTTMRRWRCLLLSGFAVFREQWWVQFSLENPLHIWRYVLLLEIADWLNYAFGRKADPDRAIPVLLVNQPGHVGDFLHTLPMLKQLRATMPEARIDVMTGPWNREIADRVSSLNDRIYYSPCWDAFLRGGPCPGIVAELALLLRTRRKHYDVVLHGLTGSLPAVCLMAFACPKKWVGAGPTLNDWYRFPSEIVECGFDSEKYEAQRISELLTSLAIKPDVPRLEYPECEEDRNKANELLSRLGLSVDKRVALLLPGAGWPGKIWPAERFAAVGDYLAERHGLAILVGGAPSENKLAESVVSGMQHPSHNIAGETTLSVLAAIQRRAVVTVCNDSGAYHVAIAAGAPVIGLFGPGFPTKWAIQNSRQMALWHPIDCTCFPWHPKSHCMRDRACMKAIKVDEVCDRATRIIDDQDAA